MYRKLLLAFSVIFVVAEGLQFQKCPDLSSIKRCDCIEAYGKVFLNCVQITDGEIKEALSKFRGKTIWTLDIADSKFVKLPSALLSDIKISQIKITNSNMFNLADDTLKGSLMSSLVKIKLHNVEFSEGLDWNVLKEMKKLDEFIATGTKMEVSSAIATKETSITTLQLSDANIELIHEQAFSTCMKLKNLILKQNLIKSFQRKMLPYPTSELQFLDLSYNELSTFGEDIFDGMPKLHSLILDGNMFKVLEKTYMTKVWKQLFYFSVRKNLLECDCEISWLLDTPKPYHIFGDCKSISSAESKQLRDIGEEDLGTCIFSQQP